jgi:ubiquitin C-terminal hydrolase
MNSILQLLFHCKPLISFLIKKNKLSDDNVTVLTGSDYEIYLEKASIEKVANAERIKQKLQPNSMVTINRGQIDKYKLFTVIEELSKIVDTFVNKGSSIITPLSFKQVVDKKITQFRNFSQHDAHEFLIHIISIIIEETGIESTPVINNVPPNVAELFSQCKIYEKLLLTSNSLDEKKLIIDAYNKYKTENKSLLSKYYGLEYMVNIYKNKYNPFIHQIQSILNHNVQCPNCKNISSSFEHTPIIQLYVSDSLELSLKNFTNSEVIDNYKCSLCEYQGIVNKTCIFWSLPYVLFIQFKRFEVLQNGRNVKNNKNIDIPLILDLNSYCDNYMNTEQQKRIYQLKGYCNHFGNLNGGHYNADCVCIVDNKTWYHFDDSNVTRNTNEAIDTAGAYILMYVIE